MDAHLQQIGVEGASVLYPAVTEEELEDLDQLVTAYRRHMGYMRLLFAGIAVGVGAYIVDYVRHPRKR